MKRSGFSLVEMAVYSMLISFLAIVAFSWTNNYHQKLMGACTKSAQVITVHTALQQLSYDVQKAEAAEAGWISSQKGICMHEGQTSISWHQEKDKLYRTQGGSKALVATQLRSFECSLDIHNKQVKKVACKIAIGDYSVYQLMRVCNG